MMAILVLGSRLRSVRWDVDVLRRLKRFGRPTVPTSDRRTESPPPIEAMRQEIGDRVLVGSGYEVGAGMIPSRFAQVSDLTIIDKRDAAELAQLFAAPVDYQLVDFATAMATGAGRGDFITAHHVLEHCPDPIGALRSWLPLLRVDGCLYISLPSAQSATESLRDVTPVSHLLGDYLRGADGSDYDSRRHIPEFVNQWTAVAPNSIWYAQSDPAAFARQSLAEQARQQGHDLHWHTFTADTLAAVVEAAFFVADLGVRIDDVIDNGTSVHCVAFRTSAPAEAPASIREYVAQLREQIAERFPGVSSAPQPPRSGSRPT